MRAKSSILNFSVSIIGQFIGSLFHFVTRYYFIRSLDIEYLGINGLFLNILEMLSLVELGIGPAIIFSLYKPLASGDQDTVKALMKFYQRVYCLIGMVILCLGILFTPMLPYLIKERPQVEHFNLIYFMFVLNASITYFFSYKASLLIADQKRYLETICKYTFMVIMFLSQITLLLLTGNYLLYLSCQIVTTLLQNIVISFIADRRYPYLKTKTTNKITKEIKSSLVSNMKGIAVNKAGSLVINYSDNIVISRFIGLAEVGLYANYYLILAALNHVMLHFYVSIVSSIGNVGVEEDRIKLAKLYDMVYFIHFWAYGFFSVCLICLFHPFITLWIGQEYSFSFEVTVVMVISFYISGMKRVNHIFRDALGLYWHDRFKPAAESFVKILFAILLVRSSGIYGVFLSTIISVLLTAFWMEPLIVFKYGLKRSLSRYFSEYIKYAAALLLAGMVTLRLCSVFPEVTLVSFIFQIGICMAVPNGIFLLLFFKRQELADIMDMLRRINLIRKLIPFIP